MSVELIRKIRTQTGDKQIDYTALANLPTARDILMSQGSTESIADRIDALGKKLTKANMKKICMNLNGSSAITEGSSLKTGDFSFDTLSEFDIIVTSVSVLQNNAEMVYDLIAEDKLFVAYATAEDTASILDGTAFENYISNGATGVYLSNWDNLSTADRYSVVNLCHANRLFVMMETSGDIATALAYDASYKLPLCNIDWLIVRNPLSSNAVKPAEEFLDYAVYYDAIEGLGTTYKDLYKCNVCFNFEAVNGDSKWFEYTIASTSLLGFHGVMFGYDENIWRYNIPGAFKFIHDVDITVSYLNTYDGESFINALNSNINATAVSMYWNTDTLTAVAFDSADKHYITYDWVRLSDSSVTNMSIYGGAELTGTLAAPSITALNTYIVFPSSGQYESKEDKTGILKVFLPVIESDNNVKFTLSVFNKEAGTSVDYSISGNITAGVWRECTARAIGDFEGRLSNLPVAFDFLEDIPVIYIGNVDTIWNEPMLSIHDVSVSGYTRGSNWDSGWIIDINTDNQATASMVTVNDTNILNPINSKVEALATTVGQHTEDIANLRTDIESCEVAEVTDEQIDALFPSV